MRTFACGMACTLLVKLLVASLIVALLHQVTAGHSGVCYRTQLGYKVVWRSDSTSYRQSYGCGWWGRRCHRTLYRYVATSSVQSYYYSVFDCCNGFQMRPGSSSQCEDINECPGRCEQQCKNTVGSYECKCNAGYILANDQRSCLGSPRSISVTSVGPNALQASWSSPSDPGSRDGSISGYDVTCTAENNQRKFYSLGNVNGARLSGLKPYSFYTCCIAARRSKGTGPASCVDPVRTFQDVPGDAPSDLAVMADSSTALVIEWGPPRTPNGIITAYSIYIDYLNGTDEKRLFKPNSVMYSLQHLAPSQVVDVSMSASTSVGEGPVSHTVTGETLLGVPFYQPLLTVTVIQKREATVMIEVPYVHDNYEGIIDFYELHVSGNEFGTPSKTLTTPNKVYTITGLEEYTLYTCWVAAGNEIGLGAASNSVDFETLEDVPSSPPLRPFGYAESSSVIRLTWEPPLPIDINGNLVYYVAEVIEVETDRFWKFYAIDTHLNIASLPPYSQYKWKVAAHTIGTGPFTDLITVFSGEEPATAPPTEFSVVNYTSRSLTLSWKPPPSDQVQGLIREYSVSVLEVNSQESFEITALTTVAVIYNLHPFYLYACKVAAKTIALGPYTPQLFVQLLQEAPSSSPVDVLGYAINSTTLWVSWQPPTFTDRNGIIQGYRLEVFEVETDSMIQMNTSSLNATIGMLHPFYSYKNRVAAFTIALGPFSDYVIIQMPQHTPSGPPQSVAVLDITSRSVSIGWTPPKQEHQNGIIKSYVVEISEVENGAKSPVAWVAIEENVTATALTPYTLYWCIVAAQTEEGTGSFSSPLFFTTDEDVPSPPELVNVTTIVGSPTKLFISWFPPAEPNGIILFFNIFCITENSFESGYGDVGSTMEHLFSGSGSGDLSEGKSKTVITEVVPGNFTRKVIGQLIPYTEYECVVSANTSIGEGENSSVAMGWTDEFVPADPPQDLVATVVDSSSVLLEWLPPLKPYGSITSYTITYNCTQESDNEVNVTSSTNSSLQNYTIGSLRGLTTYTFRVTASTRVGSGPPASASVQTHEGVPSSPPVDVKVSKADSTTATFTWLPPPATDHNGVISYYELFLVNEQFNISDIVVNSTNNSVTINDLEEFANYSLRVSAATRVGLGPFSTPVLFTTLQSAPSAPPQSLMGYAATPFSIALSWLPPPDRDVNGIITLYTVDVLEKETGRFWGKDSNVTDVILNSLHPHYHYECKAAASTMGGRGPYSSSITVQTLQTAPSASPQHLHFFNVTSTSLVLSWVPPPFENRNGDIQHYTIVITETETGERFNKTVSNHTITLITSLHPYYRYRCQVAAETVEIGPFSVPIVIQMLQDVPSTAPLNPVGKPISSTGIALSWEPPLTGDQNGIITAYFIQLTELESGITSIRTSNTLNLTVLSLHPYYNYQWTVAAMTIALGPSSTPSVVQTHEDVPSTFPPNIIGKAVSSTSVSLSWDSLQLENQNGIIRKYIVNVTAASNGYTGHQVISTEQQQLIVEHLKPHTLYIIVISASTSVGNGPLSDLLEVITQEDAPSGPPLNVTAVAVDSTSLSVSWNPPTQQDQNGVIRNYKIYVVELETETTLQIISSMTHALASFLHPYYTYNCSVSANTISLGPFSEAVSVKTLQDAPGVAPPDLKVVVLSPTSLFLSWSPLPPVHQNGLIVGYAVEVTSVLANERFQLSSEVENITIHSLLPHTVYLCTVAAKTSVGVGPFSNFVSIKVSEDAPISAPLNFHGFTLDSTTIYLSWDPPPAQDQNGIIRHYTVNLTQVETGNSFQVTKSASTSVTVSQLHPYYTYQCSVSAYTIGSGPYSNIIVITTPEDVPSGPPLYLKAIPVSSSEIHLFWDPPNSSDRNGIIIGYVLNITSTALSKKRFQVMSDSQNVSVNSLHPYTTYICTVAAKTSIGAGPFSITASVQTFEDVPTSSPHDIVGYALDSTTIYLSWDPPPAQDQNGIVRHYIVNLTEVETGKSYHLTSTTTSVTVPQLHPYYMYQCSVSAYTIGSGPYSEIYSIRTLPDVPSGPPTDLEVIVINSTSISLSWGFPQLQHRNGIILGYTVNMTVINTQERLQLTSEERTVTMNNLKPYASYRWTVAAYTTVGLGPFSEIVTVQTHEDAPGAAPHNVTGSPLSSTSIFLSWDPPPAELHHGVITQYLINITELETGYNFTLTSNTTEIRVDHLHPFYTYLCTVSAFTVEEGPPSFVIYVITEEDVPSAEPRLLHATALSSETIDIHWNPPPTEHVNGIIRGYILNITAVWNGETISVYALSTAIVVSGLSPFTEYTCTVAAETVGLGPATPAIFIQTKEDAPTAPPRNVSALATGSSELLMKWVQPVSVKINGIIRAYLINISEAETGKLFHFQTNGTETVMSGLHPFYTYLCTVAAQTIGAGPYSAPTVIQLPEDAPSSSPSQLTASSINSTSAILHWVSPSPEHQNGIIRSYLIVLTEEVTQTVFQEHSTKTSLVVKFLHPFYVYNFIVAAVTTKTGPFSNNFTFMTLEDAPSGPPTNLQAAVVNSTSVALTWNPPSMDTQNGLIIGYSVSLIADDHVILRKEIKEREIELETLNPFTVYFFTVAAMTSAGTGPDSQPYSFLTHEDVPSSPPTNITHKELTSMSVILSWNPPPDSQSNGILQHYIVIVEEVATLSSVVASTNTTHTELAIGSLHPYYVYTFRVAAVTIGTGPFSENYTLRTLEDIPSGPPQNLSVVTVNSRTLLLSWDPPIPEEQNGIIEQYVVNVSSPEEEDNWYQLETNSTDLTISDLHPHYTYSLTVAAVTIATGPFCEPQTTTMPQDAPTAMPQHPSGRAISSTSIEVSWKPPVSTKQNGLIRFYRIKMMELPTGKVWNASQTGSYQKKIISSLHPFYDYKWAVAAETVKAGPYTEFFTTKTLEDVPSGAPLNFSGSQVNSTALLFSWGLPSPDKLNGVLRNYKLKILVAESAEEYELQTNSTESQLTVTGLHPHYTYTCAVAAVTVGGGPFSKPITMMTPEDAPHAPPQNPFGEALNSSTIFISWIAPVTDKQNGIIRSYKIKLLEVATSKSWTVVQAYDHLDVVISSLHPYYEYEWSIAAETVAIGPFTSTLSTMTLEDVPSGPPLIATFSVVNSTSLLLEWNPPSLESQNGVIHSYIVRLTENGNKDISFTLSNYTGQSRHSVVIGGLHPYYLYSCAVAAVTIGTGPFSDTKHARTHESIPSGPPQAVQGHGLNSSSIILIWSPPLPEETNGVITAYSVKVLEIETGRVFNYSTNGLLLQLFITSLHPYYKYNCSIAAETTAGKGPSKTVQVITPQEAPTGTPQNITAVSISTSLTILQWLPPHLKDRNGEIGQYVVSVTEMDTKTDFELLISTTEIQIEGLHPFYTYIFKVAAVTIDRGPFSSPLEITLPESSPTAAIRDLNVEVLSPKSVKVSWLPPEKEHWNGIITNYTIYYKRLGPVSGDYFGPDNEVLEAVSIPNAKQTLDNDPNPKLVSHPLHHEEVILEEMEEYFVYMVSVDVATSAGTGEASLQLSVGMPASVPSGPPRELEVEVLSSTSLQITWNSPALLEQNGVITGYDVKLEHREKDSFTLYNTVTYSLHLEGLEKYSLYNVSVAAESENGIGPYTDDMQVQTQEDLPGPPRNLTGKIVNSTTVFLQWKPPLSPNGNLSEYQVIYYGDVSSQGYKKNFQGNNYLTSLKPELAIKQLSPGLQYSFQVRAKTGAGYGENSTTLVLNIVLEKDQSSSVLTVTFVSFSVVMCLMILLAVVAIVAIACFVKKKLQSKSYDVTDVMVIKNRDRDSRSPSMNSEPEKTETLF